MSVFWEMGRSPGEVGSQTAKNVENARLSAWLDFAPQAMMRLLHRKGSDEICALGGLILTRRAARSELGRRSGVEGGGGGRYRGPGMRK